MKLFLYTLLPEVLLTLLAKEIWWFLENIIFASRWFQAPMYFGLIAGGCIYAWRFLVELYEMIQLDGFSKSLMMSVLNLVDIIMIGQLLIMVIIGGWHTFVSKINRSTGVAGHR